jgi:hypothetical protein
LLTHDLCFACTVQLMTTSGAGAHIPYRSSVDTEFRFFCVVWHLMTHFLQLLFSPFRTVLLLDFFRGYGCRDSKLTFLLADSLGRTAFSVLVACVATEWDHYAETLSTLRWVRTVDETQPHTRFYTGNACIL